MKNLPENTLFSIIIPVYKIEEYLPECIESLCKQTYKNIEIILVDDGSPDNCPSICDEYALKDPRIKVIHKQNAGATAARKTGAQAATGEYICCVDGDDYVAFDYIEAFAKQIEQYGCDMACCGYYLATPDGKSPKPLRNRVGYYSAEDIKAEIYPELIQTKNATYFTPSLWGKAIRTEIFKAEQMKIDENIKIGEDGACIIPCVYKASSVCIIPDCLYFYRYNPSSVTKNGKAFRFDGPELIAKHIENEINMSEFDFSEQLNRKIVHELFTVVKSQFNRKEKYCAVVKDIKNNLKLPLYSQAIKQSRFNGLSGKLALYSLKYNLFPLIWLFNKIA